MPAHRYLDGNDRATVEFRIPPEAGVDQAWLVGEFNAWSTSDTPMERQSDGSLAVVIDLDPGAYRFRYYLGDGAWENDWAADSYVDNEHGGQDSVVVVPPPPAPPPPVKAPKKAAATKKAPAAKKATTVKKAAKKQAPPS